MYFHPLEVTLASVHLTFIRNMKHFASTGLCIITQDLPEFFEDNMETWMTNFHGLLTLDNKLLQTDVSFLYFFISWNTYFNTAVLQSVFEHVFLCFSYDNLLGWRGSRSPGAAEVSDMWQRSTLCSEVWWRIPAVSAALCHCHLEPFSFYWPGS